jgi:hypothetical protein
MLMVKRLLVYLLVGAVAGLLIGSLVGPPLVNWYSEPGAGGALCNCAELAKSVTSALLKIQFISSAVGAGVFLILGAIIERMRAKRDASGRTPPSDSGPSTSASAPSTGSESPKGPTPPPGL